MKPIECLILLALGSAIWVAGTVYYASRGSALLDAADARYWTLFVVSPIASALVCLLIVEWRNVPRTQWAVAMLLLALPGMIGEAAVLSNLERFMPKMHATAGGRYGALLFATYAVVLAIAEAASLTAR